MQSQLLRNFRRANKVVVKIAFLDARGLPDTPLFVNIEIQVAQITNLTLNGMGQLRG